MAKSTKKPVTKKTDKALDEVAATRVVATSPEHGALYKVEDTTETEADYTGTLHLPDPGSYWLEGFMRKDPKGKVYMSLSVKLNEMQAIDNNNVDRGVLYKNNRKRLRSHADYTGFINTAGAGEYPLNAIISTSKNGNNYMALELAVMSDDGITEEDMPF